MWPHLKGEAEGNGSGSLPLKAEGDEEVNSEFKQPFNALVQNCTLLHNIVGPACVFLRQGFARAQLVCI